MNGYEFKSPGEWIGFEYYLCNRNRYVLDKENTDFIEMLLLAAQDRIEIITSGKLFYRGRLGSVGKKKRRPFNKTYMLNPKPVDTRGGRSNPKGISYLYLSDTKDTAIAETRPWLEQYVSIAKVEIGKDFKVVNAISKDEWIDLPLSFDKSATKEKKEKRIWWDIDRAFSKPILSNESGIDYVPSQYLAEIFKHRGYDGIKYRSSLLENGYNIVLFDSSLVRVKSVELYAVTEITYSSFKVT